MREDPEVREREEESPTMKEPETLRVLDTSMRVEEEVEMLPMINTGEETFNSIKKRSGKKRRKAMIDESPNKGSGGEIKLS